MDITTRLYGVNHTNPYIIPPPPPPPKSRSDVYCFKLNFFMYIERGLFR